MITSSSGLSRKMKSASQVRGETGLRSAVEIKSDIWDQEPSVQCHLAREGQT